MLTHRYTSLFSQVLVIVLFVGTLTYAAADWRKQRPLRGPGGSVVATAITPDGTRAATVTSDGYASLWDLKHRKLVRSRHLPYGKPVHLDIRNQGDAIAIAFENANSVVWWCDGTDRLVHPSVQARLVVFANQLQVLAVVQQDGAGSAWRIDDGSIVTHTIPQRGRLNRDYLAVLPNDEGAIAYDAGIFAPVSGFMLEEGGEIVSDGPGIPGSRSAEPVLIVGQDNVTVRYSSISGASLHTYTPSRGATPLSNNASLAMPPICVFQDFNSASRLTPAYGFAVSSSGPGQADLIVTGNNNGDLILHQRVQADDWYKQPAPWLVLPAFMLLGWAMLQRRWHRLENPQPAIDPADALLDLPRHTRLAAWVMVVIGALAILDMVYGFFVRDFTLRIDALAVLAGFRIRQRRNGWRKFAAFLGWVTMAVGAALLGTATVGRQPIGITIGSSTVYLHALGGTLTASGTLALGTFLYLSLTHPGVRRICQAASDPAFGDQEQRLIALQRCPECGYDTRRTVADKLSACPECGKKLVYSERDRQWITWESETRGKQAD